MGLMDVLNGMANGPRGEPESGNAGSGGMSKTTMAVLAYLAYKAYKTFGAAQPAGTPHEPPLASSGDGIGATLRNIFGGGREPAEAISRGIENTVDDFDRRGEGDVARSWVGRGDNQSLSRRQLEASLGEEAIRGLQRQTGMDRDELLETLRENLPKAIDELTPEGRPPTRDEFHRRYPWRPDR